MIIKNHFHSVNLKIVPTIKAPIKAPIGGDAAKRAKV